MAKINLEDFVQGVFDSKTKCAGEIYSVIEEYFGKNLVDNNLEEILETLKYSAGHYWLIKDIIHCVTSTGITRDSEGNNVEILFVNGLENFVKKDIIDQLPFLDKTLSEIEKDGYIEFDDDIDPFLAAVIEARLEMFFRDTRIAIQIKFPKVDVQNEYDECETIYDLYVKLLFDGSGHLMDMRMNRTTFTLSQYLAGYVHSHLPRFYNNEAPSFNQPCLGSGPIGRTISYMRTSFNLQRVGLFCFELEKYVETESIEGGPYIRMSEITGNSSGEIYGGNRDLLVFKCDRVAFINKFISACKDKIPIKVRYQNGNYTIGESFNDFAIKISNIFIDYVNDLFKNSSQAERRKLTTEINTFIRCGSLVGARISGNAILTGRRIVSLDQLNDAEAANTNLVTFKGAPQGLVILGKNDIRQDTVHLLSASIVKYILTKILFNLNYEFRKGKQEEDSSIEERLFL